MELMPGYKLTEVGVIPEDWRITPLGSICDVRDGTHESPRFFKDGVPFVTSKNIIDGRLDFENTSFISRADAIEFDKRSKVERNDILLSMIGTIGNAALVDFDLAFCIKNVALIKPQKVAATYLICLIKAPYFQKYLEGNLDGGIQKFISLSKLRQLAIPLPTEIEQRAIAQALSDVDTLLKTLDQVIAKKRDLKQAAMQQLLTGKTRLPGFSGEWEVKCLGEIAHIKTGSRNNEDKVEDGQYPFFVRSEFVERINSYSHDCEAILVPGEGRIGDIFHYINGRFDVHQRVYVITKFSPFIFGRFVHFYLSKNFGAWAMQNTVKATVDSLRLPTFLTFKMRMPPTLDEQIAIANALSDIDAELSTLETRRDKTTNIKQAMMQELLTGKTRLVHGGVNG